MPAPAAAWPQVGMAGKQAGAWAAGTSLVLGAKGLMKVLLKCQEFSCTCVPAFCDPNFQHRFNSHKGFIDYVKVVLHDIVF